MTPEEAKFCTDLRHRVLANVSQGNPPHTGIDEKDLKQAIEFVRGSYTAAQGKSKAAGVTIPGPAIDLDSLFAPGKSG